MRIHVIFDSKVSLIMMDIQNEIFDRWYKEFENAKNF